MTQYIGIDPGPTPGFVVLRQDQPPLVFQCNLAAAPGLLHAILNGDRRNCVQTEAFVVGRRSGRSSTARAGAQTRELISALSRDFELRHADDESGSYWVLRNAGQVKPWATDERLDAAGLLEPTKGMRHARDAARHALFCAVKDGGIPDPLSKAAS